MYQGTLPPASNRADWTETLKLTDDDTGDPIDLTGAAMAIAVRDLANCLVLSGSIADGKVTLLETGVAQWSFPASAMGGLCAGEYAVGITLTMSGTVEQVFAGTLPIIEGIVR